MDQFANNPDVASFIQNDVAEYNFPNYLTMNTNLSATQVNLMSSLAAWSVVLEDKNNSTFTKLFQKYGPAAAKEPEAAAAVAAV